MKKILGFLSTFTLTTITTLNVISCSHQQKNFVGLDPHYSTDYSLKQIYEEYADLEELLETYEKNVIAQRFIFDMSESKANELIEFQFKYSIRAILFFQILLLREIGQIFYFTNTNHYQIEPLTVERRNQFYTCINDYLFNLEKLENLPIQGIKRKKNFFISPILKQRADNLKVWFMKRDLKNN